MPKGTGGILALLGGGAEEEGDEKVDAAKDILDAFKNRDAEALSLALERHYELCASHASDDEDEEV